MQTLLLWSLAGDLAGDMYVLVSLSCWLTWVQVQQLITFGASVALTYWTFKWIKRKFDPYNEEKKQVLLLAPQLMPGWTAAELPTNC